MTWRIRLYRPDGTFFDALYIDSPTLPNAYYTALSRLNQRWITR